VSKLVMDMQWVAQRQQEIDIEQVCTHAVSSRSWLTSSKVTTAPSG
jgi:hypothetical protein